MLLVFNYILLRQKVFLITAGDLLVILALLPERRLPNGRWQTIFRPTFALLSISHRGDCAVLIVVSNSSDRAAGETISLPNVSDSEVIIDSGGINTTESYIKKFFFN